MTFDYQNLIDLITTVIKNALPLGIIFYLAEMLVQMFLKFAFPKKYM
jgi:hypothetical protein